jgi:putative heme-binding domain-containing protein
MMRPSRLFALPIVALFVIFGATGTLRSAEPTTDLFGRDNLVAWCIVPFDAKKRGPEERAEMLARLGFKHFAYDYRAEHVPTFDAEIAALKKHGVSLDSWWFPRTLNDEARHILDVCKRNDIRPELWVTGGGEPTTTADEQRQRVEQEAARIRPIAEAAAAQDMKVGLYNHGGWFGEPENQLAIIEHLKLPNVGLAYNLHHGHDHLDRFAAVLPKMLPHLLCVNLNGMVPAGDKRGQKILQLGQGSLDLELLRTIRASGYRGPIGILGHTQDDAEARLQDNLEGLDWLLAQLDGKPAGPKPTPRTPVPGAKPQANDGAAPVKGKAPDPPPGVHLKPVDPRLKATLIDRSPNDVYLGVKVDAAGNVFVGGREAVFVFERQADGGFAPRRELLRFPPDSIIMGLEFRNDDLYVLTVNALYLVPQGRVARTDLKPQRILWGIPLDLHVSFHCLAWGPDGDLYLTHGDPLLQYGDWSRPDHWGHWTLYCGVENKPLPYTGQGAVLAMKPDGTDVRVVARGLRGPVGLAFDAAGNLFTNDNDHESRADQYAPSRLLHVVEGIDFGWPRGWMASKSPDRHDLIEPVCDLGRGVPCDMTYYDRPLLADVLIDLLLMCRWDRHSVTAYLPNSHNSTFTAVEETIAIGEENCRPVGIATNREGRLYVTALYMTGNQAAPDCVSDLIVIDRSDGVTLPIRKLHDRVSTVAPHGDLYEFQLSTSALARDSAADKLCDLARSSDRFDRFNAVLAIGRKLTVPEPHFAPPAELPLFYPKESSFFHRKQRFYGDEREIDLADLGRVGSFTIAELWAHGKHTDEQEALFAELVRLLDDPADAVRLQAAYFLSLLNDARSEPRVQKTRRDVQLRRLTAAATTSVEQAWIVGPFGASTDVKALAELDAGRVDLAGVYDGRKWQARYIQEVAPPADGVSYLAFHVVSGARQPGLLSIDDAAPTDVWQSEVKLGEPIVEKHARRWIVDLQPGTNDFLIRTASAGQLALTLKANKAVQIVLPEKLDSSQLAERLRSAAVGGAAQAPSAEFAAIDWIAAARDGDAAEGRKLFGTLGCAKCHAVVPDQKAAGGPSLFEAKRRFTVPHLVESVLLPSRQVAEPFRAQTFVTTDGRTLTGLVTGETSEAVEVLLPDAKRQTVYMKQIDERTPTQLSPMPQGLVKTPLELRHLLAYLCSERPQPP